MATTVSRVRLLEGAERATCLHCEDVVPATLAARVNGVTYCRACVPSILLTELQELSQALAS